MLRGFSFLRHNLRGRIWPRRMRRKIQRWKQPNLTLPQSIHDSWSLFFILNFSNLYLPFFPFFILSCGVDNEYFFFLLFYGYHQIRSRFSISSRLSSISTIHNSSSCISGKKTRWTTPLLLVSMESLKVLGLLLLLLLLPLLSRRTLRDLNVSFWTLFIIRFFLFLISDF